MTHFTKAPVTGSHDDCHVPLTVFDILRAGVRRRVRREGENDRDEADAAHSTWDSEGGR